MIYEDFSREKDKKFALLGILTYLFIFPTCAKNLKDILPK